MHLLPSNSPRFSTNSTARFRRTAARVREAHEAPFVCHDLANGRVAYYSRVPPGGQVA